MSYFLEGFVPAQMGAVLRSALPNYVARQAIQPLFAWDFMAQRGKEVLVKRPNYWSRSGKTFENYQRTATQLIGTANNEPLSTTDIRLYLKELTGPSVSGTATPSSLRITKQDMLFARTNLWNSGSLQTFHDSIGSNLLRDDWQSLEETIFLTKLGETTVNRNPGGAADNATYATAADAQFQCVRDLLTIGELMTQYSTPRFPDGFYHGLLSPRMFKHLMADSDFRETQRSIIAAGRAPAAASQLINTAQQIVTPSGIVISPTITPVVYGDFMLWVCQTLNDLSFATTSAITSTSQTNVRAHAGYFFGAGAIAEAMGGPGPQVLYNGDTDYGRIYNFIWQKYWDCKYVLTDDQNSGVCVEMRTYAN